MPGRKRRKGRLREPRQLLQLQQPRPPAPALLTPDGAVAFLEPETGVSPGQACVFYESLDPKARVLGGGFIAAA